MIDVKLLSSVVEAHLAGTERFPVSTSVSPGNVIEVVIDSDTDVSIDHCAALSRAIEEAFDREKEDFELTVCSAGIGQPLTLPRQFRKMTGRTVEVVLKNGGKAVGELAGAEEGNITVTCVEKVLQPGEKRKKSVQVTKTFAAGDVKLTRQYLDFK